MQLKIAQLSVMSTALLGSIALILLCLSVGQVTSRPSIGGGWPEYHARFGISDPKRQAHYECETSSREVRELCQRCAKVTKSKLAYPMCCESRENAREWCRELLMIG